jgi:RNA polymerase sigma factor (sigma-70 family)
MDNLNFIIDSCRDGDVKQQKVLYNRYYGYALNIALKYTFQHDEACFVVNDSFIKLFRSIDRFVYVDNDEIERQLMAWLKRIVINTAIDALRRDNYQTDKIVENASEFCDTDNSLLYKELVLQVSALPKSYLAVFNMHVIDGFKHFEIAHHLGISVGTSKSNLSKAKSFLRRILKEQTDFSLS